MRSLESAPHLLHAGPQVHGDLDLDPGPGPRGALGPREVGGYAGDGGRPLQLLGVVGQVLVPAAVLQGRVHPDLQSRAAKKQIKTT